MFIYDLNESYSVIDFSDETEENALKLRLELIELLSCFVDNYQFTPAYRAGYWDGKKHFFDIGEDMSMRIPKGLVQAVITEFSNSITRPYTPIKPTPELDFEDFKTHIKSLNLPFKPYDYQIKAVIKALRQPRIILLSATGSGKSLMIFILMTYFKRLNKKGILIVPNVGLVGQMAQDFEDYDKNQNGLIKNDIHTIYAGREKHLEKPITITTWQSGILMEKEDFKQLDYIIIDEAHLAAGDSLTHLLEISENCLYKIGMTGTLPKENEKRIQLVACLGKSERIINMKGLINRGLATPVSINTWFLNYNDDEKNIVKNLSYQKEVKFLEEHARRNRFLAKASIAITQRTGNSIMLYNTITHGEVLLKNIIVEKFKEYDLSLDNIHILEKITPHKVKNIKEINPSIVFILKELKPKDLKTLLKFYSEDEIKSKFVCLLHHEIFFIRGDVKGEDRNEIRSFLENCENGILIATYGTFSTGSNVKNIHNIFLCSSTKSFVRVMQTIGRGVRLHHSKDVVRIFDLIDDFSKKTKKGKIQNKNYMLKHFDERINYYFEDGFEIKEREINI